MMSAQGYRVFAPGLSTWLLHAPESRSAIDSEIHLEKSHFYFSPKWGELLNDRIALKAFRKSLIISSAMFAPSTF
jgi:hypothetical protein